MFKKIQANIRYPEWVKLDPRYKKLDIFDRLLDGTFYDDLPYAFYDEKEVGGKPIPLTDRRPSAQYRLPRMVARWCARKLFAGRHAPRIWHKDVKTRKRVAKIAHQARLNEKMLEAVMLGSVGSVALTFRVSDDDGKKSIAMSLWRAKYCYPSFNSEGDLETLRICYVTHGGNLMAMENAPAYLKASESYWFIRDYTTQAEITYQPVQKDEWNPIEGFAKQGQTLTPWEGEQYDHALGFVPGHWFVNLAGGCIPDGACTWEDAIPNSIEIDYTLSQTGRGVRYNCAPQLVIKGEVLNADEQITRGPTFYIHLSPDKKDEDGNMLGGADAKLLEMTGAGTKVSLELVHHLRNMALEQISASRKDPEKIKGQLSGRAMEFMDEESDDMALELRSQYGDHGMLPLLRKIVKAIDAGIDADNLALQWPRLKQPTPDEIAVLIPALVQAVNPMAAPSHEPVATGAPDKGSDPKAKPAKPAPPAMIEPDPNTQLLTVEEARAYLKMIMDLSMMDLDGEQEDDLDDEAAPGDATSPDPTPLGEKVTTPDGDQAFATNIGQPVKVNA